MDFVCRDLHLAADMVESRACVVGDLILAENAAGDLTVDIRQRFQSAEHLIERVIRQLRIFRVASIVFCPGRACQKSADGEKLHDAQGTADLQTFQGISYIPDSG